MQSINYESNEYDLINNKLLIVSGYQLISFFNSYGGLYDYIIQKVDDSYKISEDLSEEKQYNVIKILNENKTYYIDFSINHLIKLDNNFSDAEVIFTDENNIEFVLNSSKRIIKLEGKNIKVKSNKKALIYFYQEIEYDEEEEGEIFKSLE